MTWWQWILSVLAGLGLVALVAALTLAAGALGHWLGGR